MKLLTHIRSFSFMQRCALAALAGAALGISAASALLFTTPWSIAFKSIPTSIPSASLSLATSVNSTEGCLNGCCSAIEKPLFTSSYSPAIPNSCASVPSQRFRWTSKTPAAALIYVPGDLGIGGNMEGISPARNWGSMAMKNALPVSVYSWIAPSNQSQQILDKHWGKKQFIAVLNQAKKERLPIIVYMDGMAGTAIAPLLFRDPQISAVIWENGIWEKEDAMQHAPPAWLQRWVAYTADSSVEWDEWNQWKRDANHFKGSIQFLGNTSTHVPQRWQPAAPCQSSFSPACGTNAVMKMIMDEGLMPHDGWKTPNERPSNAIVVSDPSAILSTPMPPSS